MLKLENLPEELLIEIMRFLPLEDRKNMRLLNRKFCELSSATRLVQRDVTVIVNPEQLTRLPCNWRYFNIRSSLTLQQGSEAAEKLSEVAGSVVHLDMITFDPFHMDNYTAGSLLSATCNLTELKLHIFPHTPCAFRDKQLVKTESLCLPKLKKFWICVLRHHDMAFCETLKIFEPFPSLEEMYIEYSGMNVMAKRSFHKFLGDHKPLVKLSLKYTYLSAADDVVADSLGEVTKSLFFFRCFVHRDIFAILFKKTPYLEELNLEGMSKMTDAELENLLKDLIHMKRINLSMTGAGPLTMNVLCSMENLVALNLNSCKSATAYFTEPSSKLLAHLVDLRLDDHQLNDSMLYNMATIMPNLEHLSIKCDSSGLTGLSFSCISMWCRKLRSLVMHSVSNVFNLTSLNYLTDLTELDLSKCSLVSYNSLGKLSLPKLRVYCCMHVNIPSEVLEAIFWNCDSLKEVILDEYLGESDSIIECCKTLKRRIRTPDSVITDSIFTENPRLMGTFKYRAPRYINFNVNNTVDDWPREEEV